VSETKGDGLVFCDGFGFEAGTAKDRWSFVKGAEVRQERVGYSLETRHLGQQ
jgi:hypothetical protein